MNRHCLLYTSSVLQAQVFAKVGESSEISLMNMPTGSGKTLCSIKFALERALRSGKKRIIYIIPFNSIIDQTVGEFEGIFQEDAEIPVSYTHLDVYKRQGGCSDKINNMVSEDHYHIIPRFGAHVVLDRKISDKLTTTLMETPHDLPGGGHTKGMAIIPTTGGTMILGCDACLLYTSRCV